jgi:hypothetical protein
MFKHEEKVWHTTLLSFNNKLLLKAFGFSKRQDTQSPDLK